MAVQTIVCPGCGGSFAVDLATPVVVCSYCHQPFEPEALARVRADAHVYALHQAQADQHAQRAAQEKVLLAEEPSNPWALLVLFPLIGIIGLSAASVVGGAGLIDEQLWLYGSAAFGALAVLGTTIATLLHGRRVDRQASQPVSPGQRVRVCCPGCGAPAEVVHGQFVGACAYCGAGLVPGAELMASAIDAAQMRERYELFRAGREERRANARVHKAATGGHWHLYVVPLMFAGFGTVSLAYDSDPLAGVTLWGMAIATVAVVGIRHAMRATQGARLRRVFQDMATQLGGQVLAFDAATQWLDAYWPGSAAEAFWLHRSPAFAALVGSIYGYPCYVQLVSLAGHAERPYAVVIVACVFAQSFPDRGKQAMAIERWLKQRRFDVTYEGGGVSACRDLTRHPAYKNDPADARELATIAAQAAHLAHVLGGRSSPPMPP